MYSGRGIALQPARNQDRVARRHPRLPRRLLRSRLPLRHLDRRRRRPRRPHRPRRPRRRPPPPLRRVVGARYVYWSTGHPHLRPRRPRDH